MAKQKTDPNAALAKKKAAQNDSWWRESKESLAVALILALLFRGFVAEAFIIPTGSMAPALTGAHKDVICSECGARYQTGASSENDDRQEGLVVSTYCENCRHENPVQFGQNAGSTFSGDRIMVSKFAYALHDPERWDVIVFKFPYNAKQNYIKRLVGLPGETIHIRHGDIYRSGKADSLEILRKPDDKLMAMRHLVYDTNYQSQKLINAGFPSRWQPWAKTEIDESTNGWQIKQQDATWSANFEPKASDKSTGWLRYFHNIPTREEWDAATRNRSLDHIDPFRSGAITDFYAYNGYVMIPSQALVSSSNRNSRGSPKTVGDAQEEFKHLYTGGASRSRLEHDNWQLHDGWTEASRDGLHWVGDLMLEADLEVAGDQGIVTFELVEAGRRFRCELDVANGTTSLSMIDQDGNKSVIGTSGSTALKGKGEYKVLFANCDDELKLWVNGSRIELGNTQYPGLLPDENFPHYSDTEPGDSAPAAIGAQGVGLQVSRAVLHRDKYYTSVDGRYSGTSDYRMSGNGFSDRTQATLHHPADWQNSDLWKLRRTDVQFELKDEQFLPMGDNSPESRDGRCWGATSFVHRDLLTGKALLIFWPHPWHRFLPHFSRMGLIR